MSTGAFRVLEFPNPHDPPIVYTAQLTSSVYLQTLREVGTYRLAYEQLRTAALGPEESAELIGRLAAELTPVMTPASFGSSSVPRAGG